MQKQLMAKLDWGSYFVSIAETTSKKIGVLIHSMKFLYPELLFIAINLPYSLHGILLWSLGGCS